MQQLIYNYFHSLQQQHLKQDNEYSKEVRNKNIEEGQKYLYGEIIKFNLSKWSETNLWPSKGRSISWATTSPNMSLDVVSMTYMMLKQWQIYLKPFRAVHQWGVQVDEHTHTHRTHTHTYTHAHTCLCTRTRWCAWARVPHTHTRTHTHAQTHTPTNVISENAMRCILLKSRYRLTPLYISWQKVVCLKFWHPLTS